MFRSRNRRAAFKKGIDTDESRRKRETFVNDIRKQKREAQIQKKRAQMNREAVAPSKENQPRDPTVEAKLKELPQMTQDIYSTDVNTVVRAVTKFRKLLSIERDPPIQEVISAGVVPQLVKYLTVQDNHTLQFEAAWALTNIASGTTEHTKVVIHEGAVPLFVQLLSSNNPEVAEQAVWALGNVAGDSHDCRDMVLHCQALNPLISLVREDAKITLIRNVTWTLSNLCRGKPQPNFEAVRGTLPVLAHLLQSSDTEVLTDACWALSYLSDDTGTNNAKIQAVIEANVVPRLVELLMHHSVNVKTPALRTVGNIVTGDDLQTQSVLNCNALPSLNALLNHPKKGIRKEACWTISNITAGNKDQIKAVISANIIPPMVYILKNAEFDIKKEAAWAISNATSGGSDDQIRYLVVHGCVPPLCDLFKCLDVKIILVALEGIENILRVGQKDVPKNGGINKYADFVDECGGLGSLEALQYHDNQKIYLKAQRVLREFFDAEEEEDTSIAPTASSTQYEYQAPQMQGGFNFSN